MDLQLNHTNKHSVEGILGTVSMLLAPSRCSLCSPLFPTLHASVIRSWYSSWDLEHTYQNQGSTRLLSNFQMTKGTYFQKFKMTSISSCALVFQKNSVQVPFLGNLWFVYIVACSVTGKSGVIAKLTWTTCILHAFGSQERGLFLSETPFFHSFTHLPSEHLQSVCS